ncbi:MAG: tetratricopeptide repeat protein [Thermoanaerobaculaceae bacterium]|nr:tetratricopeptide repeat protein [Thermoanaerobaculaceae bacterium]MDI9622727.1 tetratricopeptide repeat protein [Acidobacteriota bacterium]HPW56070.1 tetratricopeptide repeat protein [Thermoanaerobaculaceae bacterium]
MEAPGIRVTLLGGFGLASPAGSHRLESAKTEVLLAYLVLAPGSHARAKLQGLLWPDLTEERAARNLRHALWDIRRTFAAAGAGILVADRSRVAIAPHADVVVDARELITAYEALRGGRQPAPRLAIDALLQGELLDGVFLGDAPELEQWLLAERERLRAVAYDVLRALVALHRQQGDLTTALAQARALIELDPWREESHRTVMELLTQAGEPAAALAQFEECRRVLAEQLQTTPTADTVRLAERIRAFSGSVTGAADPPLIRHNLPAQATPFVGRESEIAAVERLLLAPECRLVSLLGPGGIGKSRLALQVAQRQVLGGCTGRAFADGVWFVPPQEGGEAGGLAAAVARALALGESPGLGALALEARLEDYLRHRRVLLILDGFEHLLPDAGALAALIAVAPLAKVLVTTRERLGLPGEWVVEVGGLAPLAAEDDQSPAVQLFVQSARRARFGLELAVEERAAVAGLCAAVEGSPLAIELAGGWAGSLTVREIAAEVARHPGFLGSREGGLRAIFDSSWSRLGPEERRALAALSVFVGGCTREAAEAVAGASIDRLRRLVDTSFVRHEPSGRYTVHEVLRRFAQDELATDPAALERARAAHATYLAERLGSLSSGAVGISQREILDEIGLELDNLQVAWRWAVAAARADLVEAFLGSLQTYAEARGWLRAAEALLGEALVRFGADGAGLAVALLTARGSLRNRMGAYAAAVEDLDRALALVEGAQPRAAALAHLGATAYLQGRHGEARERLERAMEDAGVPGLRAMCSSLLGRVALEQGRHDDAEAAFETALALSRQAGDSHGAGWATNQLGLMAYFRGALDAADRLFEEALDLARTAGDLALVKEAAIGLGYVREDRGNFGAARGYYREALAVSRESGDRRGEAHTLMVIGETHRRSGELEAARSFYRDALEIAGEIGSAYLVGLLTGNLAYLEAAAGRLDEAAAHVREVLRAYLEGGTVATVLPALVSAAEVLHRRGASARAVELLGLVFAHPANRQDHSIEAERVLVLVGAAVPPRTVKRHLAAGAALDLDEVVLSLAEEGSLEAAPDAARPARNGRERAPSG